MRKNMFRGIIFLLLVLFVSVWATDDGFILIRGAVFQSGDVRRENRQSVRIEDFEILDHPLTNQEYKQFVDDTGYRSPLHWEKGKIPEGREQSPVIFVNRTDVRAYLHWRSKKENRHYRLPTSVEFEYAARGGLKNKIYPWGDDNPEDRANYNRDNKRRFDQWQFYLKPATWGFKNGYGLYGMAGNVWQMTINREDPATKRWQYRIEDFDELENSMMGGSWSNTADYMRCGFGAGLGPGIRHPNAGFRPVREPNPGDWDIQFRKLTGVALDNNRICLSWALLKGDDKIKGFYIYRAEQRNHAGFLINEKPVESGTMFIDTNLTPGKRYHYYIRPVDAGGNQINSSERVGVTLEEQEKYDPVVTTFKPLYNQGGLVPIFGELNGDGALDCVIRLDNGNKEMSQDPGLPVQLEAFTSWGRSLWRKDICRHDFCYGSANNVPYNVWDMDGDGRAEVITRLQIGDSVFVAILNGLSGRVLFKTPWPEMVSDFNKSSTRIHLSIAYLDGVNPAVITQTGLYENEVFTAYDNRLNKLWQFNSFAETSGSGGHKIEVCDVDGDGKQEVFDGTTCLNADGTLRWSIYKQHPDKVKILDFIPERPGLEVWYVIESSMYAGMYMVDAGSGEVIWKEDREDNPAWTHGHAGWAADIWDGSKGMECLSNRQGHEDRVWLMYSADGRKLMEGFPLGYRPFEWDGDESRELLSDNGFILSNFNGREPVVVADVHPNPLPDSQLLMTADLCGDFRDELVIQINDLDGRPKIAIITATQPVGKKYLSAAEQLDYRLWVGRNMGGGYASIYDQPLMRP
ncbi:SUMF1/EgtB/PvdO family nonheme iron enzyme [candidate division KSB1 bacterium]|nr:SUMF1/EgtB/PvdO family nonheme iron enzyme [candidate division KSB1 bacterium]